MPALNFQKQFIDKILSGEKRQTIRPIRKNPIKVNDTLQLYYGLRTKYVRHLINVICRGVEYIEIGQNHVVWVENEKALSTKNKDLLAQADGFICFEEMFEWFHAHYNLNNKSFIGNIIYW